ncbi:uncharacterized protein C11orf52 homolog [Tamandua tetradactyla]|uniref:uncharacterized protein C11orf52 homolog n=1 Tax=Tamandua tetradactyla TaxID=48850 RepID=UPI004053C10A
MQKPLYCRKTAGLLPRQRTMGNQICCGGRWSFTSTFQRKKKTGNQARQTLKQQQQLQQWNGTKGPETPGHTYEREFQHPKSQEGSPGLWSEENSLHYADIQVFSHTQPRSAWESEDTTVEYATLRFPQAMPHYDSKKGTLV